MKLFTSFRLGKLELQNRVVMAPMTRSRATGNIPNDLMAEHYGQRANAGLIITEGTAPTANGLGYPRIPGIYSDAQVEGWKKVTRAVHDQGSRIFLQLMHTGRVSHPLNMEAGTRIISASAIVADGNMYTDQEGNQPHPVPEEMTVEDIRTEQQGYVSAAKNAIAAGFDGVELHGANGSLIAGYGYTGILVAFLARHNPLAIIPVAILFGGFEASSGLIQRRMDLPDATILVFEGMVFVIILLSETLFGRMRIFAPAFWEAR